VNRRCRCPSRDVRARVEAAARVGMTGRRTERLERRPRAGVPGSFRSRWHCGPRPFIAAADIAGARESLPEHFAQVDRRIEGAIDRRMREPVFRRVAAARQLRRDVHVTIDEAGSTVAFERSMRSAPAGAENPGSTLTIFSSRTRIETSCAGSPRPPSMRVPACMTTSRAEAAPIDSPAATIALRQASMVHCTRPAREK